MSTFGSFLYSYMQLFYMFLITFVAVEIWIKWYWQNKSSNLKKMVSFNTFYHSRCHSVKESFKSIFGNFFQGIFRADFSLPLLA